MSTIAFVNISQRGHVNPTLPVAAELVRRGHRVTYHAFEEFRTDIEATGAELRRYPVRGSGGREPRTPIALIDQLATAATRLLPAVLDDLRTDRPDLVVHDAACLWGQAAADLLDLPAASSFTTFAFNDHVRSPADASWGLLADATAHSPRLVHYAWARWLLHRRHGAPFRPLLNLVAGTEPLNLVYTSPAFQIAADTFDASFRFVGPSLGDRRPDPSFPLDRLRDPVVYASLGTIVEDPDLLRRLVAVLAPLAGTLVLATGLADPAALGPLPGNVIARRSVPQLEVLSRASLFATHAGMNSVNEALYHAVPMLMLPQGADQPLVAARVEELGAGVALSGGSVSAGALQGLAGQLLANPRYLWAARRLAEAQRAAGGFRRAASEIEAYLARTVPAPTPVAAARAS
jgi:MGT family glycosyltransferase